MNANSPHIRDTEMNGSVLESFGGQKESTETYAKARELRRWIAAHPGSHSIEMPSELQRYLGFLLRKRLVTWVGHRDRKYTVRSI